MSPCEGPAPLPTGTGPTEDHAAAKLPSPAAECRAAADGSALPADVPALFDAVIECHAYGRRTTLVPSEYVRGPSPRLATTGPDDAQAPLWWWAEAERVVMALVGSGHQVSSDDLHERFPCEPSASGAAFGGLFAKLARAGKLREVGMVRSRRPEARRRRIILWGAGDWLDAGDGAQ